MRQIDLFSAARVKLRVPQSPDPDAVRERLNEVLQQLRSAESMPWEAPKLRSWQHVFHNMANWLPAEERDRLRQEFSEEIERLQRA